LREILKASVHTGKAVTVTEFEARIFSATTTCCFTLCSLLLMLEKDYGPRFVYEDWQCSYTYLWSLPSHKTLLMNGNEKHGCVSQTSIDILPPTEAKSSRCKIFTNFTVLWKWFDANRSV